MSSLPPQQQQPFSDLIMEDLSSLHTGGPLLQVIPSVLMLHCCFTVLFSFHQWADAFDTFYLAILKCVVRRFNAAE